MRWRSYVAVGDSFTEGMNDFAPDGSLRGWADLVATHLATRQRSAAAAGNGRAAAVANDQATPTVSTSDDSFFRYANLAIRGRLFDRIVDEQAPLAVEMAPDLVSFAGGGNDVLRRHFSAERMIARFDEVVGKLRATGADVILFRWANITGRLPGRNMFLPRMAVLNRAVEEVADRHGALMVDLWNDEEFHNPLLWSDDRLHMSTVGHQRVAAHVLTRLGVDVDQTWFDSPGLPRRRSWPVARAHDLRWAGQYLAPWVKRRLTGRSSGDTITAKRPGLLPYPE